LFTIRDPLWNSIPVDAHAVRLLDTRVFQRLRYVRQLGFAYLVYPGATHTRFEHALGAYHLARRTLRMLDERGELSRVEPSDCIAARDAALLHDVGHYPYSHALEEIGAVHHEAVARPLLTRDEAADELRGALGDDGPERVLALITGTSRSPLQGLISGSLDLDKIEYLKRDALMCGVPYGEIDVDRLLASLTIIWDADGRGVIGVLEKGLSALESLLFAKYQMYRNVYWHHAVRSATAMYKRLVEDALRDGALEGQELASFTDEGLLHRLESRTDGTLLAALRERRLHKRAYECPAGELPEGAGEWIATDRPLAIAAEDALADELRLLPGDVLLDFPIKPQMLGLDLPVVRRDGSVQRLTAAGFPGAINLPLLSEQLYRSARVLRVLVSRGTDPFATDFSGLVNLSEREVRARLAAGAPLLG